MLAREPKYGYPHRVRVPPLVVRGWQDLGKLSDRSDDAVERQARAYNAHDLDEFIACYAYSVVVEDERGGVLMAGRDAMREHYRRIFDAHPNLHATIMSRMRVGSYIVDEEHVSGRPDGDLHAIVIYRLDDDGLIDRVRFLR